MYYSVKTLAGQGKSNKEISKILDIHRNTVGKIKKHLKSGHVIPEKNSRKSKCEKHHTKILECMEIGCNALLIHRKLKEEDGFDLSYSSVRDDVKKIKGTECYIPFQTPPGQEAQIDFGYCGRMKKDGKMVKVWVFCMVLSYSRKGYYEFVTNQRTETFINCHINGFEFFGGVPATVKIDNLKSAVLEASFYEPLFQVEYNNFLNHYGASGITCRVRRGQDKGKVESGVKYVKSNFVKGLQCADFYEAQKSLKVWTSEVCNRRVHGTIRKIPDEVFLSKEKHLLKQLPSTRYEFYNVEKRKVNNYGHIFYKYNYYSVPYKYQGRELTLKTNGKILRIFDYTEEVAVHCVNKSEGEFITTESHKPPYKQRKESDYYDAKAMEAGTEVYSFAQKAKKKRPYNWQRILLGVLNLKKKYGSETVNLACKRAIKFDAISSRSVKEIIEKDLYMKDYETEASLSGSGFASDLSIYENLFNEKEGCK